MKLLASISQHSIFTVFVVLFYSCNLTVQKLEHFSDAKDAKYKHYYTKYIVAEETGNFLKWVFS